MTTSYDAIIIGAGPAGSAAAASIARMKWKTLLFDKGGADGFLGSLRAVQFFPGFPEPISGQELIGRFHRQAEQAGAERRQDTVINVDFTSSPLVATTAQGENLTAHAIVLALGAAARSTFLSGEREFLGRGVSHDALLDGSTTTLQTAAVIGKTLHAANEAITLARFASHVHFIIPSAKLDIPEQILRQLEGEKKIELHYSASLKTIHGSDHVTSITILSAGQEKELPVVGVFTYVHEYHPMNELVKGKVEMAEDGAILVDTEMATSVKGVFACGDILCGRPQLPAVAAVQGLLAGLSVERYLFQRSCSG